MVQTAGNIVLGGKDDDDPKSLGSITAAYNLALL